jgi:hypothetical protein
MAARWATSQSSNRAPELGPKPVRHPGSVNSVHAFPAKAGIQSHAHFQTHLTVILGPDPRIFLSISPHRSRKIPGSSPRMTAPDSPHPEQARRAARRRARACSQMSAQLRGIQTPTDKIFPHKIKAQPENHCWIRNHQPPPSLPQAILRPCSSCRRSSSGSSGASAQSWRWRRTSSTSSQQASDSSRTRKRSV